MINNTILNNESNDDITPPLALLKRQDGCLVSVCDAFGSVTTFMAMVPQGILGALLADKILLQLNTEFNSKNIPLLIVRIGIDGIILITAEEGKRRLVRFFNRETFKNYGRGQWWKDNVFTHWTITEAFFFLINASFTIVASGVFAGLAAISFDGMAELLQDYQSNTTDTIGQWVKCYYIKAPFMLAAFISNLPFFPAVHRNAIHLLGQAGLYLITNPQLRHIKQAIIRDIRAAQLLCKQINEKKDEAAKQKFLMIYNGTIHHSLAKRLVRIGQNAGNKIKPESWFEFLIKHGVAVSLTSMGIVGLYNFLDMTDEITELFHLEQAAPFLRWMDYSSMSAVAFVAIYNMAYSLMDSAFGRNYSVNLISNLSYIWILLSTFLVCTLGGAPNTYQSILAEEYLAMIFFAAIDSLLMESYGYYQLTKSSKVAEITKNNANIKEAYEIDTEINDAIVHIENVASTEEINDLGEITSNVPAYRSSFNFIRNSMRYYFLSASQNPIIDNDYLEHKDIDSETAVLLGNNRSLNS